MPSSAKPILRRTMLTGVAAAAGLIPALGARAQTSPAPQYGVTPPNAVQYRDSPNHGHQCSTCRFYIPAADPAQPGHCHVVAGLISPHGWCSVWTAKT